jgi:tRNA 5-methylaminomethyl-2-thiouridine biosynthesis bifunctional protein
MTLLPSYDAIIIGGGLAGAGTAYALAKRSLKVLLCETHPHLAAKASGNARGLLMPYVATSSSPPGRLYAKGFHFTRDLILKEFADRNLYVECGAIQLPATKRLARILTESDIDVGDIPVQKISATEGSEISGITIPSPSFFIPNAGYCRPAQITQTLASFFANTTTISLSTSATALTWSNNIWGVTLNSGEHVQAPIAILCGAHEISNFPLTKWIPLEAIRGQTAQTVATSSSIKLRSVVSYDGYITPEYDGVHFVGAHYRHNDMNETPSNNDTGEILARLHRTLPDIAGMSVASSRVCFRASTHDRMPYIGELPLSEGSKLFINAGHGSRGLLTAPLGGEIIARAVVGEPIGELHDAATIASASRLTKRFECCR